MPTRAEYRRAYRSAKRARGECISCKEPAKATSCLCESCTEKARYHQRARKTRLQGYGRCSQCFDDTAGGFRLCPRCRDKKRLTPEQRRRRTYGLNEAQYDAIAAAQNNCCAICGEPKPLVVDHCHTEGRVRGLLCGGCNTALGHMKDDPARLRNAIDYLAKGLVK